jgi:hypothetical protein
VNEFLVLFNNSFVMLKIDYDGFWNSTMCLEDWIDNLKPNHMGNGIQPVVAPSDKVSKKKKTHKKFLKYSLSETSKSIFVSRQH